MPKETGDFLMSEKDATQKAAQVEQAELALKLKGEREEPSHPAPGMTAREGMHSTPNTGIAPSGALNAEGQRPVLERSRKVR
jgi:hypothetical protein